MAIGVNSSIARNDIPATTATTTISKPTGTGNTGVLVVVFGTDQSGTPGSITPPAGWTAIFTNVLVVVGSTGVRLSGYWALGSVANLGFTNSSTGDQQGWVCREFTGVNNTTPIDVVDNGGTNHNTGSASLTVNSVTVATANAWELIAFASWLGGTNSATGFTAAQNVATPPATNADATLLHNPTPKGTGATGTVVVTSSSAATGQILIGVPFALRPAVTGTPTVSLLTSVFDTTGGTSMTTPSVAPAANSLLIAIPAVTGSVATDWIVTDSLGGTWEKDTGTRAQKATDADEMEVQVRTALATGAAMTFTYSHGAGAATGGGLIILQVTNMTRTGIAAIRSRGVQNNQASGTAPAPVLNQATLTANPTVMVNFNSTNPGGIVAPANWTRLLDTGFATAPTTGIDVFSRDSGFAGTTITGGSNNSSAYCTLAIELDASAPPYVTWLLTA
jgi:hypothetical protein